MSPAKLTDGQWPESVSTDNNTWVSESYIKEKCVIPEGADTDSIAIEENDFHLKSIDLTHSNGQIHQTSFIFSYDGDEKTYDENSVETNPAIANASMARIALTNNDHEHSNELAHHFELELASKTEAVISFDNKTPAHAITVMNNILSRDSNPEQSIDASSALSVEELNQAYQIINTIEEQQPQVINALD